MISGWVILKVFTLYILCVCVCGMNCDDGTGALHSQSQIPWESHC